jgi:O-antigen ligase
MAAAIGLVGISQLAIVYLLTVTLVRTQDQTDELWQGWIWAVTLSAALILISYANGKPLLPGIDAELGDNFQSYQLDGYLLRATFFVTGIIFPIAVIMAAAFAYLLAANRLSPTYRVFLAGTLLLNALCLFVMNNKTAMGAAGLGLLLIAVGTLGMQGGPRRLLATSLIIAVICAVAAAYLPQLFLGDQLLLLTLRLSDHEGFAQRLPVWGNIIAYTFESPRTLLLGLGPELSVRRADHPLLHRLFTGNGIPQGAADSGYIYLLLNYGIVTLIIACGIALHAMHRLARSALLRPTPQRLAFLVGMIVWVFMAATQQHGVSKPVFLLMQMVALAQLSVTRSVLDAVSPEESQ